MDLDRACLELMIKLLELDQDYSAHQDQLTAKEVEKVKEKIRKLCETVHNKHLDLENITVGCTFLMKESSFTYGCTFLNKRPNFSCFFFFLNDCSSLKLNSIDSLVKLNWKGF